MIEFAYPTETSTLYSNYNVLNTGADEILEVASDFTPTKGPMISRSLLLFSNEDIISDYKTTNNYAILTFLLFVISTLIITYFASKKTKNKDSFYAAGGKITGLQNGLAIAGDYMSAASFLGISGLVFFSGFDG